MTRGGAELSQAWQSFQKDVMMIELEFPYEMLECPTTLCTGDDLQKYGKFILKA
nr:AlNc14C694G12411 [Albugo laibachii Nc14]|eukprot:CCA27804.1 AlNc14C694G12411 [Albugo laibachii Nc14]